MPRIKSGYFDAKRKVIVRVKNVIKENKLIKSHILVAKLNVNYPYLSEKTALEMIKNLTIDGQIFINENDEVSLTEKGVGE